MQAAQLPRNRKKAFIITVGATEAMRKRVAAKKIMGSLINLEEFLIRVSRQEFLWAPLSAMSVLLLQVGLITSQRGLWTALLLLHGKAYIRVARFALRALHQDS